MGNAGRWPDDAGRADSRGLAMTVLELRRVSKVYGKGPARVQALRDVDLSVAAGAMVAVMGQSGSGKSTLLTIAGSLEEPTGGGVLGGGPSPAGLGGTA